MFLKIEVTFFLLCKFLIGTEAITEWEQNLYPNQILNPIYNQDIFSVTDELHVDEFVQDRNVSQSFRSKEVIQWQSVATGGDIYLVGLKKTGITLVSMYRKQGSLFQIHELPIDLKNISCIVAFKAWSYHYKKFEPYVLIAKQPPLNSVHWYKIKNYKLELMTEWIHTFEIKEMIHIENESDLNTITFFQYLNGESSLSIYTYSLDQHIPHIWFQEWLPLEKSTTSIAITVTEQAIIIATIQINTKGITLYRHKTSCIRNCKFIKYATVGGIKATKIQSFSGYGKKFFGVSGSPSKVLLVNNDGSLQVYTFLKGITELIVLNIPTTRGDVVILGKNSSNVEVYTLSMLGNTWIKRPSPPCIEISEEYLTDPHNVNGASKCLGHKQWDGATFIMADELSTIVFPGDKTEIIHVICSLRPPSSPQSSTDYFWLSNIRQEFQNGWRRLHTGLDSLLKSSPKSDDEERWNSICDMNQELDRITHLLHTSRLKLNSIDCTSNNSHLLHSEVKSSANQDTDGIIIRYMDRSPLEKKDELEQIKGKTWTSVLKELPYLKPPKIKEAPNLTRHAYRTKISTDLDGEHSKENHENEVPPLHMIVAKMMDDSIPPPF